MTYSPPHTVIYKDKEYDLRGDSSEGLPMFDLLGIRPRESSTAGNYFARYKLKDDLLYLDNLYVIYHLLEDETLADLPTINGLKPTFDMGLNYNSVLYLMPITGQITIARNPIWNKPEFLGMPEFINWLIDYEIVLRLSIDKGRVTKVEDFSVQIEALRLKHNEIKTERAKIWQERGVPLSAVSFDSHRWDEMSEIFAEMRKIVGKEVSTFYTG